VNGGAVKHIVFYHRNCQDGFCAAYVYWRDEIGGRTNSEYRPWNYGDTLPPIDDLRDHKVVLLDVSFPRDFLLAVAGVAKEILVFDHHKTAQQALGDLPFATFDMEQSGAGLIWRALHRGADKMPALVAYVEDADLWRFALPDSRLIRNVIQATPHEFEKWQDLEVRLEDHGWGVSTGRWIQKWKNQAVELAFQAAEPIVFGDHHGMAVNNSTAMLHSEIGEVMLSRFVTEFACCYFFHGGFWTFSLRSRGDFDVSVIAKQYGGGGHKNAAGFRFQGGWMLPPSTDALNAKALEKKMQASYDEGDRQAGDDR